MKKLILGSKMTVIDLDKTEKSYVVTRKCSGETVYWNKSLGWLNDEDQATEYLMSEGQGWRQGPLVGDIKYL